MVKWKLSHLECRGKCSLTFSTAKERFLSCKRDSNVAHLKFAKYWSKDWTFKAFYFEVNVKLCLPKQTTYIWVKHNLCFINVKNFTEPLQSVGQRIVKSALRVIFVWGESLSGGRLLNGHVNVEYDVGDCRQRVFCQTQTNVYAIYLRCYACPFGTCWQYILGSRMHVCEKYVCAYVLVGSAKGHDFICIYNINRTNHKALDWQLY